VSSLRVLACAALFGFPALLFAGDEAVSLAGAWVRALPPTQTVTAAYVEIRNAGDAPVTINGASVEGAGRVEFHTTREVDGMLRMERLDALSVPAGDSLSLAPGGVHLMLFDLDGMPQPGTARRLCLQLQGGREVCTMAAVRMQPDGTGHAQHH